MKHYLGVSAGYHDAALSVVRSDGQIMFAAHSERYSGVKNDTTIHRDLWRAACEWPIDVIALYERPWMHNIQQAVSGQHAWAPWTTPGTLDRYVGLDWHLTGASTRCYSHHLSHAAAGFQTSPFDDAAVVVIDAIGELDCISIYRAWYDKQGRARYKRLWRRGYPHSIGLFYSAMTQACGLQPMEEEYITMGMSAYGNSVYAHQWFTDLMHDVHDIRFKHNFHAGIDSQLLPTQNQSDLAACAQHVTECLVMHVIRRARAMTQCNNLVYSGGVALNCVANRDLGNCFNRVWIMPNPGDAGSSLGAAALAHGSALDWHTAYLGHDIPGPYPVAQLLHDLTHNQIAAVASGRAEFGPRALGNRSLLADPRGTKIKQQVNAIKQRQQFRPFAPAILEELCDSYFDMPRGWNHSRYMQVVAGCRHPDLFPAITHVDGTSRVQTVPRDGSGLRQLLEAWYETTGCPMLLNTSLNVRGEPMVNDRQDADRFEMLYHVPVRS